MEQSKAIQFMQGELLLGAEVGRRTSGRLFRLAISCPTCGTRPALRVTEDAVRDALRHEPGERLGTYQCHRRRCSTIYDLPARAYQQGIVRHPQPGT